MTPLSFSADAHYSTEHPRACAVLAPDAPSDVTSFLPARYTVAQVAALLRHIGVSVTVALEPGDCTRYALRLTRHADGLQVERLTSGSLSGDPMGAAWLPLDACDVSPLSMAPVSNRNAHTAHVLAWWVALVRHDMRATRAPEVPSA